MKVLYSNDGYQYVWNKDTQEFQIINPQSETIYSSNNPVETYRQYQICTELAFQHRIRNSGYNLLGEKTV